MKEGESVPKFLLTLTVYCWSVLTGDNSILEVRHDDTGYACMLSLPNELALKEGESVPEFLSRN